MVSRASCEQGVCDPLSKYPNNTLSTLVAIHGSVDVKIRSLAHIIDSWSKAQYELGHLGVVQ